MDDNMHINDSDEVDFSYPEGFEKAAKSLDFLPDDETRRQILLALVTGMAMQ
ncbi:MAG: hypothetical protein FWG30_03115 [Eubacteriaceae bacterium]|nr:hypothetical protein [Eubacteriaceae bacterium]